MQTQRQRSGWAVVLTALLLAGCASVTPAPVHLAVNVMNVAAGESTLLESAATVTLRLTNESSRPLQIAGGAHTLYLNGTYVGRGTSANAVTVPAWGTAIQPATVYIENLILMRKAAEFSRSPTHVLGYRLESRFEVVAAGRVDAVATGELDLGTLLPSGVAMPPAGR
jgi:LEA14-like dessication related protein